VRSRFAEYVTIATRNVNNQSRSFSPKARFGVLIALVIVITCGIMLPYRNITGDSPVGVAGCIGDDIPGMDS
jgi:hypothetical protein